jgi:hypothetical protein
MVAKSLTRYGVAAVICDRQLFAIGQGDTAELDAVAAFGTDLNSATMYTTRKPDQAVITLLEKCGLRRIAVLQTAPDGHDSSRGIVDYLGGCVFRMRDMMKSLPGMDR